MCITDYIYFSLIVKSVIETPICLLAVIKVELIQTITVCMNISRIVMSLQFKT